METMMASSLLALSLLGSLQVATQQIPPPPIEEYEFFGPTRRTHSIVLECAMDKIVIGWTYDEGGAKFTKFKLHERAEKKKDLDQLNSWASELDGDLLVIVSCGGFGVNVAMSEVNHIGVRPVREVRTIFDGEKFKLVRKENF